MPFTIVRNDITKMRVDAIVNAAKPSLLGGGGVDGAIHAAAGPELLAECRTLGGCKVGEAKCSAAYRLPCRYVIHTVGPKWHGGYFGEERALASSYRAALELAKNKGCESVAFPLISAGHYGFPKDRAMRVAVETIGAFLLENDMDVSLVVYGAESTALSRKLFADVQEYIDEHYVEQRAPLFSRRDNRREESFGESLPLGASLAEDEERYSIAPEAEESPLPQVSRPKKAAKAKEAAAPHRPYPAAAKPPAPQSAIHEINAAETTRVLDRMFVELDESFQQMLLRKIDESGMSDAQCYKKANIDRKLFSKIRKDVHYRPSKTTAVAFAIALELNLWETESLLSKAGYALSRSSKFDIIIQYFIERRIYDVFAINEVLFYYDQSLLGA